MTIKIGVLGTSWIANQAVEALFNIDDYEITAVLGSSLNKASDFIKRNRLNNVYINCQPFKDYVKLLKADVDCIYIALPNNLHYEFAKQALLADKNVIVEKPIFSSTTEYKVLKKLADSKNLYLLEAMRSIYTQNYNIVRQFIKQSDCITGATIIWKNYSSKYNAYKKGQAVRVFSKKYFGGALADLGVYVISASIDWFGSPKKVSYYSRTVQRFLKTDSSVLTQPKIDGDAADLGGTIILNYSNFDVTILLSKTQESFQNSEIYTDNSTLVIDNIAGITTAKLYFTAGDKSMGFHNDKGILEYKQLAKNEGHKSILYQEFKVFADIIKGNSKDLYKRAADLSLNVLQIMDKIKKDL
jgi:predicted dehydrogenase